MALVSSLAKGLRKTPRESLDPIGPPAPTGYAGTLPSTVAELNGWTLASIWDFAHNFKDITGSPNTVDAMPGSSSFQLTRIGSSQATVISAPQSGYADQAGITITTSSQTLYKASLNWSHSATVPTVYLCTFRFESAPVTKSPQFLGGHAGDGINGFYIQAHATSGIRASIGNGTSGFVATSYIGGTDFYDGEWHTLALCIDDAAGKVKLACGAYSTESTGLTIYAPVAIYCTVGATYNGDPAWEPAVSYLLIARGQHPLAYTNFETALDEYEDARLNNVNQTAIAGLPTAISDLNSVTGLTFTNGYNITSASSNPVLTGASGPTLVPDTGTLRGGGTGTQPTLAAAPQIRTSFTSQTAATFDSDVDNFGVAGALPASDFTMLLVWKAPASFVSGASIAGLVPSVASTSGWQLLVSSGNTRFFTYHTSGSYTQAFVAVDTSTGGLWHVIMVRAATGGLLSRIVVNTTANSSSAIPALTADSAQPGNLGSHNNNAIVNGALAFTAWLSGQTTDANMTTAIANFRWRYGL